jgi:hypothetical protein
MSAAAPLERLESRSNETRNETTEKSQMPRISSYPSGADTQNGRVLTPALKIIDWEHRTMNGFGLRGRQDLRMRSTERGTASAIAVRLCLMGLVTQIVLSGAAAAQSTQVGANRPPLMDRQREIALALSACPPSVANKAAVYVLDKAGYVKVRDGENGFTAIVQHSVPPSQEPQRIDAEGSRTFLPRILKVAELRAQGMSGDEIRRVMADALAKGLFHPPTRPGVDCMLSTENVVPDDKGVVVPFPPHVMFYAPYMTNSDPGSEGQAAGGPAFVAGEGTPFALIIVPVGAHTDPVHSTANMPPPGSP